MTASRAAPASALTSEVNAAAYGVKGNAAYVLDAVISSGSPNLSSATADFSTLTVGDVIQVKSAGVAGAPLTTTIASITDATHLVMAANSQVTGTGKTALFGHDDTAALTSFVAACYAQDKDGVLPGGKTYLCSATGISLTQNKKIQIRCHGAKLLPLDSVIAVDINVGIVGSTATGYYAVDGLEVEGANMTTQTAFRIRNSNRYILRDCRSHQCAKGLLLVNDGTAQPGSVPGYCEDGYFENCHFDGGTIGIDFQVLNSAAVSFEENTFIKIGCSGNTTGVRWGAGTSSRNVHMYNTKIWCVGNQTGMEINGNMAGFVWIGQVESLSGSNTMTYTRAAADQTGYQSMHLILDSITGGGTWGTKHLFETGGMLGWIYFEGQRIYKAGGGTYFQRAQRDGENVEIWRFDATGFEIGIGNVSNPDTRIERIGAAGTGGQWHINRQLIADDSIQIKTKSSAPGDADYAVTPTDGTIQHDSSRTALWVRQGGSWLLTPPSLSHAMSSGSAIPINRFTTGYHKVAVADNTAFTIQNPTGAVDGLDLTIDVKNNVGGAMGTITWDTLYLLAGSWTNPANGKRRTIRFYYDGTNWVETTRAAADI